MTHKFGNPTKRFYSLNKRETAYAEAEKYGLEIFYVHRNDDRDSIFIGTKKEWDSLLTR